MSNFTDTKSDAHQHFDKKRSPRGNPGNLISLALIFQLILSCIVECRYTVELNLLEELVCCAHTLG